MYLYTRADLIAAVRYLVLMFVWVIDLAVISSLLHVSRIIETLAAWTGLMVTSWLMLAVGLTLLIAPRRAFGKAKHS